MSTASHALAHLGVAPSASLTRVTGEHVAALTAFLDEADLTLSGLDAPSVRLWADRGPDGTITGSTGYELSVDRRHALIRSVAVSPAARRAGYGSALARFALARAAEEGAEHAWLFSRRSGPFWQKLGFVAADRDAMATALADTHQVRLFASTGQLAREVAWSRPLTGGRGDG
ncbi:GNAT family N-acetyltransferase [Streptomyces abyssomicinicus]|uniref:GNAT family N-acetyltransferase n=1 Tax=Streptomyces abyssomicinicus TaxID=574929 RepID=UPI00124FE2E2|nr:GNAT family N-acetyltransferase [Streptomyces abyssomicinicus]